MDMIDVIIIGAGPIGLEAAVCAKRRGLRPLVLEAGLNAGEHVSRWGHVRFFTPFGMNASAQTVSQLQQMGVEVPDDDAILTAEQYRQRYLKHVADFLLRPQEIEFNCAVQQIARGSLLKTEQIGTTRRAQTRFRVIAIQNGRWKEFHSHSVLDCSGVYGQPNPAGAGGVFCEGEQQNSDLIIRHLPDITGKDRDQFANRTTAVIGTGYSAATAIFELIRLAETAPSTRVIWLNRNKRNKPVEVIENDALAERAELAKLANAAVERAAVRHLQGVTVCRISRVQDRLLLHLNEHAEPVDADQLLSLTGYRPDRSLYEELHVHECYATQGPIKLAASLLSARTADCLTQPVAGVDLLKTPEPGFLLLGSKSYGRNPQFLLQHGLKQVEEVVNTLTSVNTVEVA